MSSPTPLHRCQNCHCHLEEDDAFCPVCGQKRIEQPITLRELIGDAFSNIFALDSKLLRTLYQLIFHPGSLTVAYWQGARQRYYTPFKLFLFWLTIFVLLFNWKTTNIQQQSSTANSNIAVWRYQQNLKEVLKTNGLDSLMIDTLIHQSELNLKVEDNIFHLSADNTTPEDLYTLPLDSLVQRRSEGSFIQDLLHRQLFKAQRRPGDFGLSLIGNLSWVVFISIPLLALWLLLLFRKKQPYYTAHLTFTLHIATMGLLLVVLLLVWSLLFPHVPIHSNGLIGFTIFFLVYTWFALRGSYHSSILGTSLKLVLVLLGSFFIFIVATIVFLLLNFLLF